MDGTRETIDGVETGNAVASNGARPVVAEQQGVAEAGDDGQGALVERLQAQLRKAADEMREEGQNGWPVTCDDAADRIEALTRENAALRADKERLERERNYYKELLSASDADRLTAERRLAEQGQAGLRGAAQIAAEAVASTRDVHIPAEQGQAQGEVRGWLHENPKFGMEITFNKDVAGLEEHHGWIKTPLFTGALYATPPSPEPDADLVTDFWHTNYVNKGHCGLCGNIGKIDTRGVKTPAGFECGGIFDCLCPNGQTLARHRKQGGA